MCTVHIFPTSVFGSTLEMADYVDSLLSDSDCTPKLYDRFTSDDIGLACSDVLIFMVATTGNGDFPKQFRAIYADILSRNLDLSSSRVGVIAFGDSSYKKFCGAGEKLHDAIQDQRCECLCPLLKIDASSYVEPEDVIAAWLASEFRALVDD
ncbi:flavodoxin domain-containing protein [Chromohalobacter salexigens]|uniref:flavodoxin domain-containing protein n=1 Tax=Chromohalobacter israelensis TaxID=141390 RepID=UPI0032E90EEE